MAMHIYIPTRGRVDDQVTLSRLPPELRAETTIVCPADEVKAHRRNWPDVRVAAQPDSNMRIGEKRAWIFRKTKHEKIMMLDDDIRFARRMKTVERFRGFEPPGSRGSGQSEWGKLCRKIPSLNKVVQFEPEHRGLVKVFKRVEWALDRYRHGGINQRFQQQEFGCEFALNKRVQYALAYHVPTLLDNCVLGRLDHREDFDYTLQLLRRGFQSAVYCWANAEQKGYGRKGGVSSEKTFARHVERSNAAAYRLAKYHPGLVKVVQKDYKKSLPRCEVIVYWQKAAEEGQNELL